MKIFCNLGGQQVGWPKNLTLKMKLTFLLIFLCFLQVSATVYSQSTKFSFKVDNKEIVEVLREIEDQSKFRFFYLREQVDVNRRVSITVNDATIEQILDELFKDKDLNYEVMNDFLVVLSKPGSNFGNDMLRRANVMQQQRSVSGRVMDQSDQPLPGVSIVVKGTTQGTVTNADGKYSLINIPDDATLVFSFVGMRTQEVIVGSQTNINVTMEEDVIGIEEVVAIGYGTVRKSDLTGSVSSIKADELQATPITSIDQGLVGRAAGVMVTQTSGMPGAIASIRIRGTSSLQGGNEPLYVIDGFPVYNGTGFGNTGGKARYSGLSTINPADIESLEILKDASATAIYGARAANGVVLITTKSGQRGTDQITFDATYGIQSVVKKIDVMNALEYAELVNEAFMNDNNPPIYDETKMQEIRQNPEGTNWQDEVFRSAPTQDYQLTFSGGDNKMIYSVTANYCDQKGIIRSSDFKRYSGRVNLERNILSSFRIGSHISISKTISNAVRTDTGGNAGVVSSAMKFNPIDPVFINEDTKRYTLVNSPGVIYPNPVATADEWLRENNVNRVLANIFGEWEIVQNLKAKISFGTDIFNTKFNTFLPDNIYESGGIAQASINGGYTTNWLNENTLNWNKQFGDDHKITLLGGITFQKNYYEGVSAASRDFVNNMLEENSLGAGAVYDQPSSSNTEWSILSYIARANYSFKERYILSFNGRIDGSSRFGKNNKYAFFPSGAFAWRLIEEDFIKDMGIFSNLKIRTSYGFTGNQEIGLFNSLATLGNTTYTFGRQVVTGFFPNKIPNPNLKWEKTSQFDAGIDIGLWRNRLRITADYYLKKTTDLIYSVPVPYVSGFSTSIQNIGSIQNQGLELAIESDNFIGDFQWTTNFNISFNRNKVLELGGEEYKDVGSGDGHLKTGSIHRLFLGEPIGLFFGYVSDGIFQNQIELDAGPDGPTNWVGGRRYADLSGPDGVPDGKVEATYDRAVIGNPNPDFYGGMTNTFFYKGFELNLFLQYSYGNDIFNYNSMEMLLPSGGQNVYADLVNRWTPTNPSNKYPVATTSRSAVTSDLFVEDGSYLKVKTLTLAYLFNDLNIRNLSGLKLFVTGQNLFTFTNYSGFDPEVSYRGATNLEIGEDFGTYPQAKTILVGVRLNIK